MPVQIALLNIQCLISKYVNKLMSLDVKQIFKEHDIILFTETLSNKQAEHEVQGFEHYALHRVERKNTARRDSGEAGDLHCKLFEKLS